MRIDTGPPFSALFTLWLLMMQAVGLASRSTFSRHSTYSASWIRSNVPSQIHHVRRKQAPPQLVEPRADRIPSQLNGGLVDHAIDLPRFAENRNPQHLSQSDA
jgi:hypothetical protein